MEFGPYEADEERGEHLSTSIAVHNSYPKLATTASVCTEVLRDDEIILFWYRNYDSQTAARSYRKGHRCNFNGGRVSALSFLWPFRRRHVASHWKGFFHVFFAHASSVVVTHWNLVVDSCCAFILEFSVFRSNREERRWRRRLRRRRGREKRFKKRGFLKRGQGEGRRNKQRLILGHE